ncbi:hypothetical protein BKA64DRAFT_680737 [Cadophora sp. MPI-SDFR-AT-0126]|nr:hypothetical protein BKA64DRAFT_680737 [Leotiomycetes sp. MPI-SDFR-AT-0126]
MSLFATTQKLVEETLFYWTKEWVPEVLASKKWEHPEQTELNYWFRSFDGNRRLKELVVRGLAHSRSNLSYEDLRKLLQNLQHIRHAAVHRKRLNTPYIRELMADAIRITHGMDDLLRNKKIREMQKALIRTDLERLRVVIGIPIEDFDAAGATLTGPLSNQGVDGMAGQHSHAASREHADLHTKFEPVEGQSGSSENNRKGLVPAERGFGIRRENRPLAFSNDRRLTRSLTKNAAKVKVIDLTEDGDDDIFGEAREKQPNVKKRPQEDNLQGSNMRAFNYVGQSFIEISDTDSDKESGEIDEGTDPEDGDDENLIHFSNAPRMRPDAQYKRPRLGRDF